MNMGYDKYLTLYYDLNSRTRNLFCHMPTLLEHSEEKETICLQLRH